MPGRRNEPDRLDPLLQQALRGVGMMRPWFGRLGVANRTEIDRAGRRIHILATRPVLIATGAGVLGLLVLLAHPPAPPLPAHPIDPERTTLHLRTLPPRPNVLDVFAE